MMMDAENERAEVEQEALDAGEFDVNPNEYDGGMNPTRFTQFNDQELWALRNGAWLALEEDEADYDVAERLASEVEAEMLRRGIDLPEDSERGGVH